MKNVMVLLGSVRTDRSADQILAKLKPELDKHKDIKWDIVDPKELDLPFYDESATPNSIGRGDADYVNPKGRTWAERVKKADGYILMAPEYNHGYSAVLKNALDWVGGDKWGGKPVTFVGYGAKSGGIRAVEQLRQVVIELHMMPLHDAVHIAHAYAAFNEDGEWKDESQRDVFTPMLDELVKALA
jgi:NAD(P)H-dependent FMN reductase